jgi:hypothetical protein
MVVLVMAWTTPRRGGAAERITYQTPSGEVTEIVGEVLVTAQDGGQLVVTDEGQMLIIQPEAKRTQTSEAGPLVPIDAAEAARRLCEELPPGFMVHRTKHYVIVHNTQEGYARSVGVLFESLYRGFHWYFKNQGFALSEPKFPLVALVFGDQASFNTYAKAELGDAGAAVIGYYNLESNRMTTYNVPNLERNVATIIHEATHQLAYNTGLQTRFADNPMWVSEGLAVFFEAPNFASPNGWSGVGHVNQVNLIRFRNYLATRSSDSLVTLLCDDLRFRNASSAGDAYAEAWALTYFLLKTKKKKAYIAYLRELSEGKPLVERGRRERIEMFERIFETDLATLDRQFITYMARVQ